jgi:hypothetical protein
MVKIWTHGTVTVKPGGADEFVVAGRASIEIFALDDVPLDG